MRKNCRFPLVISALLFIAFNPSNGAMVKQVLGTNPSENFDFTPVLTRMKSLISEKVSPGVSVLVAQHGNVIFKEASGTLNIDSMVPIASMTKTAVASAFMILVDQQKLSLEDPISKYFTEFRGTPIEKVTVRQLLCHTSGVAGVWNPNLLLQDYSRPATHIELARHVAQYGHILTPGEFRYADANYDLICAIAEKLGLNFETHIRNSLFTPLKMRSSFDHREGMCIACGGGMRASLDDIYALYQMHLNGGTFQGQRILSVSSANEMHGKQASGLHPRDKESVEYGFGFFRDRVIADGNARTIYHSGFFGTLAWIDFDTELVGVLFFDKEWQRVKPAAVELQFAIRAVISASHASDASDGKKEIR